MTTRKTTPAEAATQCVATPKKRGANLQAHPYSRDIEQAILKLSRVALAAERKALNWFLANCLDDGYTEVQIANAFNEYWNDVRKKTLGVRYFRGYLKAHVEHQTIESTNYSEAW